MAENEIFKFYFLPTRLWEFLTGYFIFFRISKNNLNYDLKTNFYSYLILVILLSYLIVGTNQVLKNQILTIIITITLFFFSYNRKNFLNFFLTAKFNQIIASYSYTIFLVHYPVIFFSKYFGFYEKNYNSIISILLLIFTFTYIIYNFENLIFKKKINISLLN